MNKIDKLTLLQLNFNKIKTFESYTQIDKINKKLELLFIYHTSALEGNSLSLTATQKALDGQTVGGKTMKEHLEVTNLKESLDLIKYMAEHHEKFRVPVLLEIYYTVLLRSNMKMAWIKTHDLRSKKRINNEFRKVAKINAVHSAIYIEDIEPLTEIITAPLIKNMKMYIKAPSNQYSSNNER